MVVTTIARSSCCIDQRSEDNARYIADLQRNDHNNNVDEHVRVTTNNVAHGNDRCYGEQNGDQERHSQRRSECYAE
jgi:hypothetical protein